MPLLLVVMPGATSFLLLVAMPLLLVDSVHLFSNREREHIRQWHSTSARPLLTCSDSYVHQFP